MLEVRGSLEKRNASRREDAFEWFLFVSVVPSFVSRPFPVVVLYLADFVSCSLFLSNDLTCFTHLTRQAVYPSELCKNRE